VTYPTTPVLLSDSRFRQFRIRTKNDTFLKLRRIYSPEQLKKELDRIEPEDTYATISKWTNPERLGVKRLPKPKYPLPRNQLWRVAKYKTDKILNNNLLGCDFLMDFDLKDFKESKEMENNVTLARLKLQELGMVKQILIKTPSGGRQILVMDFNKWANVKAWHPSDRENKYLQKMNKLCNILIKAGISWDIPVSKDVRRISRVPNSVRLSTGRKASLIEFDEKYLTFAR
jgi:hypothetical protein